MAHTFGHFGQYPPRQGRICLKGRTNGDTNTKMTLTKTQVEKEMYDFLDDAIRSCFLTPETAKFVVAKMDWNVDDLKRQFERLTNNNYYGDIYGNQVEPPVVMISEFVDVVYGKCQVCYEFLELMTTSCGHNLCFDCWGDYLSSKIKDENVYPIPCFGVDCNGVMADVMVNLALEWDENIMKLYNDSSVRSFAEKNPNLSHCPNPRCDRTFKTTTSTSGLYECECGTSLCLNCKSEAHAPISCHLYGLFNENEEARNLRWMNDHAKKCPQCQAPIEKNGGCEHMTCRKCRFEFCWQCLKPWVHHNKVLCTDFRRNNPNTLRNELKHQPLTRKRYNEVQELVTELESALNNCTSSTSPSLKDTILFTLRVAKYAWHCCVLHYYTTPDRLHTRLSDLISVAQIDVKAMVFMIEVNLSTKSDTYTLNDVKTRLIDAFDHLKYIAGERYTHFKFTQEAFVYDS